jgi:hypothetical protein
MSSALAADVLVMEGCATIRPECAGLERHLYV